MEKTLSRRSKGSQKSTPALPQLLGCCAPKTKSEILVVEKPRNDEVLLGRRALW